MLLFSNWVILGLLAVEQGNLRGEWKKWKWKREWHDVYALSGLFNWVWVKLCRELDEVGFLFVLGLFIYFLNVDSISPIECETIIKVWKYLNEMYSFYMVSLLRKFELEMSLAI